MEHSPARDAGSRTATLRFVAVRNVAFISQLHSIPSGSTSELSSNLRLCRLALHIFRLNFQTHAACPVDLILFHLIMIMFGVKYKLWSSLQRSILPPSVPLDPDEPQPVQWPRYELSDKPELSSRQGHRCSSSSVHAKKGSGTMQAIRLVPGLGILSLQ